jgi:hypothetical protein
MFNFSLFLRKAIFISLFLALNFSSLSVFAADFEQLRAALANRNEAPKIYLPERVIDGQKTQILIIAPGASEIDLQMARIADAEYKKIQSLKPDANGRAEVILDLKLEKIEVDPKAKKKEITFNGDYFFKALVFYPNGESQEALCFGSAAAYSNDNKIVVEVAPDDMDGLADMARAFIPGIGTGGGASGF